MEQDDNWYDTFGELYDDDDDDDDPSGAPDAADDSWKTTTFSTTFGKPLPLVSAEVQPAGAQVQQEQLTDRLRSKEQLLKLATTAKEEQAAAALEPPPVPPPTPCTLHPAPSDCALQTSCSR